MKECTEMFLPEYFEYLEFLKCCKEKQYDVNLVLHKHHIVPKNHGGTDHKRNFIKLSVEDHATAHLLFAKCFDTGTQPHISNLRSARILNKQSTILKDDLEMIAENYMGVNNPFYGKTHSIESIEKMLKTKEANGTTFKDENYEMRYGENANLEKEKRSNGVKSSWANMDVETRNERKRKFSESAMKLPAEMRKQRARLAALKNKPLLKINGVIFESMKDAKEYFDMTEHFIRKNFEIVKIKKDGNENY